MSRRPKIQSEFIKRLAVSRFPNDKNKQKEFCSSPPKAIEFQSNDEFFALTELIQKDAIIARMERIETHSKAILASEGDPRHEVVKKILPLLDLAFRKIEQGKDYGFYVSGIDKLCIQANMEFLKPWVDEAIKTKSGRVEGGRNSHGLEAEDRQRRDAWMQAKIERLCLDRGLKYSSAIEHLLKNWTNKDFKKISRTTVMNRTVDPTKK